LVEAPLYKPRDRFPIESMEFLIDIILPAALGLTAPVTEVPETSLDGKGCRCVALSLVTFVCWSPNLLEP